MLDPGKFTQVADRVCSTGPHGSPRFFEGNGLASRRPDGDREGVRFVEDAADVPNATALSRRHDLSRPQDCRGRPGMVWDCCPLPQQMPLCTL